MPRTISLAAALAASILAGCAAPQPGYLDPEAADPALPTLLAEYRAYVAADETLGEASRGDRIFLADAVEGWWRAGLEESRAAAAAALAQPTPAPTPAEGR